ncbi:uncharacterized protein Tsen54 isoform X2 [Prorops nasuta]
MSVQQAYANLINAYDCSLEEYRVYSHLNRCGYRIQRFQSNIQEVAAKEGLVKRAVIIDPENGLRLADLQLHSKKVEDTVRKTIDEMICTLETSSLPHNNAMPTSDKTNTCQDNSNKQTKGSKVEIINDETLLGNFKIVKEPKSNEQNVDEILEKNVSPSKYTAKRIQRNVKLLPKRNDKPTTSFNHESPEISIISSSDKDKKATPEKRKASTSPDRSDIKKSKQEVIELSDDEIEELPRPMTRMEMLNMFPNLADHSIISTKISTDYIPHNIKPQRNVYNYDRQKLQELAENDSEIRANQKKSKISINNEADTASQHNALVPFQNRSFSFSDYSALQRSNCLRNANQMMDRFSFIQNQSFHNRNPFQNMIFNFFIGRNRWPSHMVNLLNASFFSNLMMRNFFFQNQIYHNQNNFRPYNNNHRSRRNNVDLVNENCLDIIESQPRQSTNYINASTLGASSWAEWKEKLREEKTIVIDDDEQYKDVKNNEVEVVKHITGPLITKNNVNNLKDVYERLNIIKPEPEKTFRRNKGKYKISFNVFPCNRPFKKSNPGDPMFRLIVIRGTNEPLPQPVEIYRLQQESKHIPIIFAYVNMAISYIQPGIVSIPNLT